MALAWACALTWALLVRWLPHCCRMALALLVRWCSLAAVALLVALRSDRWCFGALAWACLRGCALLRWRAGALACCWPGCCAAAARLLLSGSAGALACSCNLAVVVAVWPRGCMAERSY